MDEIDDAERNGPRVLVEWVGSVWVEHVGCYLCCKDADMRRI